MFVINECGYCFVHDHYEARKKCKAMKLTYNCHVHAMDYGHVANDFSMLNAVSFALANYSTMEVAGVAVIVQKAFSFFPLKTSVEL